MLSDDRATAKLKLREEMTPLGVRGASLVRAILSRAGDESRDVGALKRAGIQVMARQYEAVLLGPNLVLTGQCRAVSSLNVTRRRVASFEPFLGLPGLCRGRITAVASIAAVLRRSLFGTSARGRQLIISNAQREFPSRPHHPDRPTSMADRAHPCGRIRGKGRQSCNGQEG